MCEYLDCATVVEMTHDWYLVRIKSPYGTPIPKFSLMDTPRVHGSSIAKHGGICLLFWRILLHGQLNQSSNRSLNTIPDRKVIPQKCRGQNTSHSTIRPQYAQGSAIIPLQTGYEMHAIRPAHVSQLPKAIHWNANPKGSLAFSR